MCFSETQFLPFPGHVTRKKMKKRNTVTMNTNNISPLRRQQVCGDRRIVAFFDLDYTILDCDSFRHFLLYFYRGVLGMRYLPLFVFVVLLRKLGLLTLKSAKSVLLVGLTGKNRTDIESIGTGFYKQRLCQRIRPDAQKRIVYHKKQGHDLCLIIAAPDIYVTALARDLGFTHKVASALVFQHGLFAGRLESDMVQDEKVKALQPWVHTWDLDSSYAYSDHYSDLPLLELVGKAHVVQRSKKLCRVAKERGWKIVHWD